GAQGRGSAAGSEVRPARTGGSPRGGQGGRVAGRGEDRRAAVLAGPTGDGPAGDLFVADISEAVTTRLNPEATLLGIESSTPQRGLPVAERAWRGHLGGGLGCACSGRSRGSVLVVALVLAVGILTGRHARRSATRRGSMRLSRYWHQLVGRDLESTGGSGRSCLGRTGP